MDESKILQKRVIIQTTSRISNKNLHKIIKRLLFQPYKLKIKTIKAFSANLLLLFFFASVLYPDRGRIIINKCSDLIKILF